MPHILQISDVVSTRECSLRLEPEDADLPLGALLERYLHGLNPGRAPSDQLLRESRITQGSADSLYALQDLVYASDNNGRLMDMFAGVAFTDGGRPVGLEDVPTVHRARTGLKEYAGQEISLLDIGIDRIACGYDRNWTGFHARKWRRAPHRYAAFVRDTLVADHGEPEADSILELGPGLKSGERKLKLLKSLARRIWQSQFENYSRFLGRRLVYKSGDETIDNILDGGGAICSEKVQALKFLTDHYGLESEYLLAGQDASGTLPVDKLRDILTTFDPRFARRYMRYWQHTALLYPALNCPAFKGEAGGTPVLVDATNGNVPFLFLRGPEADRLLQDRVETGEDKQAMPVRMVESWEDFYYHRSPQDIPENLFFALEGWIPFSDLMQVFDNELGLYLSADFYVAPISYRSEREFRRDREEFLAICRRGQLQCSITGDWTLDSPLGRAFEAAEPEVSRRILLARDHLLHRLDQCDGPGHQAGLVVIGLQNQPYPPVRAPLIEERGATSKKRIPSPSRRGLG